MTQDQTQKGKVTVFGATGHTARFVVSELLRRGITPIAIARDPVEVTKEVYSGRGVVCHQATVDDAASLDRAVEGAQVLVNCAGPFADTADALAQAALRAGIHYVDICAEQLTAHKTLEKFDEPARKAGIVVLPSMAFYGGLADLMVTTALGGDLSVVDSIEIMIGLDNWHPTNGTRVTISRTVEPPMVVSGGRFTPLSPSSAPKNWNFEGSLGNQAMVEVPFSEIVLISRHVKTTELHNYINKLAVSDATNPATPSPKAADERGRSEQRFVIEVVITSDGKRRRAVVRGRDIYAVTAPLISEAVTRLLAGNFRKTGASAPGEIFDAKEILNALGSENATFEILTN